MSEITQEQVTHLANLARIALTPEEIVSLTSELGSIMDHVATVTEVATPDVPATSHPIPLQNVFRDGVGDITSAGVTDIASNGQHSDTETLNVATAALTVRKTSVVISDPVNGTTNPKAIPGAVIEYCVIVANGGGTSADTLSITDPIPANTVYSVGTLFNAVTVTGGVAGQVTGTCDSGTGAGQSDATDGDNGSAVGTGAPGAGTVTLSYPSVPATSTVASRFRVELQ